MSLIIMMKARYKTPLITLGVALLLIACAPRGQVRQPQNANTSSTPNLTVQNQTLPITLPVLNALFADEKFRAELKSKLQLTNEQIASLKKISGDAVAKLRETNAEAQPGSAETARQDALQAIRGITGEKTDQLLGLARERWEKGGDELEAAAKEAELTMLPGPNAVPKDTRIVVNIPAFRMDLFDDGKLLKSYKVGIGYPEFPLPQGLRKAKQIIFNPTWTPPDEPWVQNPGVMVAAGSKQNPLGLIKIPIGAPSLIHGGKPLSKIGTFASHGCVGLTNSQVTDFAKNLAQASNTEISDATIAAYLKKRTRTQVVKMAQVVPVELRYETIVVEDGKLHIYRDVYDQNTNTEENLRAVLQANGMNFDSLGNTEKEQVLEALNLFSRKPKTRPTPKPSVAANQNAAEKAAAAEQRKAEAARQKKLRSQKEIVIEVSSLAGKGYPAAVNLDSGTGAAAVATAKP
jgi:lipoprotein-anchoring transpeptidase ErfK/SrfK